MAANMMPLMMMCSMSVSSSSSSGLVVAPIVIFFNVIIGTYEKRGHYEMVEKVGLYWHFVDLVWVFVFTFFYLV